jgi:REP element-mobilizing transposase RayT
MRKSFFVVVVDHKSSFSSFLSKTTQKPSGRVDIAKIVMDKFHKHDGEWYDLIAYCIMPNHVHVLFDTARQIMDEKGFFLPEVPES